MRSAGRDTGLLSSGEAEVCLRATVAGARVGRGTGGPIDGVVPFGRGVHGRSRIRRLWNARITAM
ncbi:hypothetical protein CTU88_31525 [Streptomyces sp. JV178]|nr:hypothetical protein CTU88_31525 [Streptomyces sp. JV178]